MHLRHLQRGRIFLFDEHRACFSFPGYPSGFGSGDVKRERCHKAPIDGDYRKHSLYSTKGYFGCRNGTKWCMLLVGIWHGKTIAGNGAPSTPVTSGRRRRLPVRKLRQANGRPNTPRRLRSAYTGNLCSNSLWGFPNRTGRRSSRKTPNGSGSGNPDFRFLFILFDIVISN